MKRSLEPTGRVYIVMKSMVTGNGLLRVKRCKTLDEWIPFDDEKDLDKCWAFSKEGAERIIKRYKTDTYKINYDKGLLEFGMIDELRR